MQWQRVIYKVPIIYHNVFGSHRGVNSPREGVLTIRTINSKAKGARGERELSNKLKEYGYKARRTQQYCGANHDADVVGLEGIHIECKRVEKLNIYDAIAQAKADKKESDLPTVFHRKNNCEWLVTMTLDDWIKIYREFGV